MAQDERRTNQRKNFEHRKSSRRRRLMALFFIALAALFWSGSAANAQTTKFTIEENTDYMGADYNAFQVPNSDLYACVSACRNDGQCKSFTFGKLSPNDPPMCWMKNATPAATTNNCCISGKKYVAPFFINTGAPATRQKGLDYPGSDYKRIIMDTADPGECARSCSAEGTCKSYTYVNPGVQSSAAICYLKNKIPAGSANNCCTSGVKKVDLVKLGDVSVVPNTNRPGGDYKNFSMATPDPVACRRACADDGKCKSYTFVKANGQSPAHCWLKDRTPVEAGDACCTSGAKTPDTGLITALVRGVADTKTKSCSVGAVQDVFNKLCSIFNCPPKSQHQTCSTYKQQIAVGSSARIEGMAMRRASAIAQSPGVQYLDGYGNFGGRGKRLGEAAMCALRELSPKFTRVRGGQGGPLVSDLATSPIAFGKLGYEHRVGYLDFDPAALKFTGYRHLSFCAPVVGCFDSVAQDFTVKLDQYDITPPVYLGALNAGRSAVIATRRNALADKYYALTIDTETADKSVTIELPSIDIVTPAGVISANPEFEYKTRDEVVAPPLAGGARHIRNAGEQAAWPRTITVTDIAGADHGIAFPSYNWASNFGWQSQLALGNRQPGIANDVWSPGGGLDVRPDYDLHIARSNNEKKPSAEMTADVRFSYPGIDDLKNFVPSWAPLGDTTFGIWVEPTARAGFSGQFDIVASEGRGTAGDIGAGGDWSGSDLAMMSNGAGSFSFYIDSGFDLKVEIDVFIGKITIIDVHKKRRDELGEGLTFRQRHDAYFASDYDPTKGNASYSFFKTFHDSLGRDNTGFGDDYVTQCLAENIVVPPETAPEPTATPGNPEELIPDEMEVPCNICGYVQWRQETQAIHGWRSPKSGFFAPTDPPPGASHWKCDTDFKSGCHDTCSFNTATGAMKYVRGPNAGDIFENKVLGKTFTGAICIPDTPVVK